MKMINGHYDTNYHNHQAINFWVSMDFAAQYQILSQILITLIVGNYK